MVTLIKALQLVLALLLLIIIHEFGHFFFSKLFGIRVDKFFLFFDIGGVKLFSTRDKWFTKLFPAAKKWETEYGIGWLPLGGYCKVSGMIDESMDLEHLKTEPQPWEFRSHCAWQRLAVMAGGVFNNFIFAIICYCLILGIWGQTYVANEGNGIYVNELAYEMGFRTGDRILAFDDYVPDNFAMLQADLARRDVRSATVLRGNDTVSIYIDRSMIGDVLNSELMFDIALPFTVDSVMAGSPNVNAGFVRGDRILAFDGEAAEYLQDAHEVLARHKGEMVDASVIRGADTLCIATQVDSTGRVGIYSMMPNIRHREYGFWESIPAGWKYTWSTVGGYLRDLKLLARPSSGAYKSVGSFIAIGQVFPATWDWYKFVNILALLSVILAVMNLIPIPGLDGGHIAFTLYEIITGRKPSDRFLMVAQMVGMVLLIALMMLAFGNDIGRLIH